MMSSSKAIQTFVRERPSNGKDGILDPPSLELDEIAKTATAYSERGKVSEIKLSGCFGPDRGQEDVWDMISPIIEEAQKGINATVFAYGVTGSGKTHTIHGTDAEPGIIPRVIEAAFEIPNLKGMSMSYVEILKDEVYDLMSEKQAKLDIRFDGTNNIIAGMTTEAVVSVDDFHEIFTESVMRRKTESTNLNSQSSRSHAILMLDLDMQDPGRRVIKSKLRLIDLAGSENNRLTGNNKERTQESAAINKSLTTLGNVIDAINRGDSRIPYRDCKLTRILSDVLGGENRGIMICCMAPGSKFAKDTYNTLDFAQRASGLKTRTTTFQPRVSSATSRPSLPAPGTGRIRSSLKVYEQPVSAVRAPLRPVSNGVNLSRQQPLVKGASTLTKTDIEALINVQLAPLIQRNSELEPRIAELEMANARLQERLDAVDEASSLEPKLSPEEKELRARVYTNKARQAFESHDYRSAKALYEKAAEYQPGNERLSLRITEMAMLSDGHLSRPDVSSSTILAAPVKRQRALGSINESMIDYDGSKRFRMDA